MPYTYSPLPIATYQIAALEDCEVRAMMRLRPGPREAVWNLFWLSTPGIDALVEHGKALDWYNHYAATPGASRAITTDALADEVLYRKLKMHPLAFMEFFEREDHSIYDCYAALGEQKWVDTVMARADHSAVQAATRHLDVQKLIKSKWMA